MVVTGTQNYRMEYVYDDNNRLLRENKFIGNYSGYDTTRYNYDNNGNMLYKTSGYVDPAYTQMGEFTITTAAPTYKYERNVYDSFNRLISTDSTFTNKSAAYTKLLQGTGTRMRMYLHD